ncbi:metallophosphoesterase [Pelagibacterium mangrovi]|uniref:metallophosphoesterase n=1 Tax=Pelagibacterium mangrovi TaxID=3119828 RepID=UPI002FC8405B
MKLWIMSDLHVDGKDRDFDLPFPPPDADVLVIAGDICDGFIEAVEWVKWQLMRNHPPSIVWVPGNHDFYGSINPQADLDAAIADCAMMGVTVLARGEVVEMGGVRIVGATLWTDFAAVSADPIDIATAQVWARNSMPDYRSIDIGLRRLRPADTLAWHRDHRATLGRRLAKDFDGPTVVITHHAPHRNSLDDPAFPDPSDGSFASDLGDMIERYRPDLWIHGHLHWRRDYRIGGTRVVCNPRGYGRERSGFDPRFVIEVAS